MDDAATSPILNGRGAAAVLAAATGCLTLGILALAADASPHLAALLNVWNPTGPLSGVTDASILIWLAVWFVLSRRWARRSVNMLLVNAVSAIMFVAALLLTFPPFMDFLQGK